MRTIVLDELTSLAIVVWVCLLVATLGDLFARTDLSVWKKMLWAVAVLIVPMGALAYMAVQSRAITDRRAARLSHSDPDPQVAGTSSISDEIAEAERLVPLIQHAMKISGILEAENSTSMTADANQIGVWQQISSNGHPCVEQPNRTDPGDGGHEPLPAVAA